MNDALNGVLRMMVSPVRSRRGTSYIEYFVVAAAMAAAAVFFWDGGNYRNADATLQAQFTSNMATIKGAVTVP